MSAGGPGGPGSNGPQAGRPATAGGPATAAEPRTLMRWIVGSSLSFRHLVVAAAVGMIALGIAVLPNMHVDVFPEFAPAGADPDGLRRAVHLRRRATGHRFFFQAEDGIRDGRVTGVQTCALPI